ncbi:MAG: toll/interleukin-1 receptor domain-containing protein [Bacteroidales bacterium]|nr:toll/interleukin-1 receptor domain-containing protein [Bacteroidales bacterium]
MIKIFISHSGHDEQLAKLITDLLIGALEIQEHQIRCSSVPGFKLPAGSHTSTQLRMELQTCTVILGLLTESSLLSYYVSFELGAGWGMDKIVIPIIGPGLTTVQLRPPLSEQHAIKWQDRHDWEQLADDLSSYLRIKKRSIPRYSSIIQQLVNFDPLAGP